MGESTNQAPESPGGAVAVRVSISTPDGEIRGTVHIDPGPMSLGDLVPLALELTDITVALASRREQKAGRAISCRAKCGACCRQMVALSAPECFYLMDRIETWAEASRHEVLSRFQTAEKRLVAARLVELFLSDNYDDERALEVAPHYFALGIPCPFLVDESCGIHPHRPTACREHNVTSPAAWCVDPINNPIMKVPMPQPISAALARLVAELANDAPRLIPLTLAPRWVERHGALRRQTWPGMELFTRFLAQVSALPTSR
ncbi:MAG: YkgJ family cysteine cluster protein [Candidatus Zixiibacteriota bacterium]